jgi:hypothetical protein
MSTRVPNGTLQGQTPINDELSEAALAVLAARYGSLRSRLFDAHAQWVSLSEVVPSSDPRLKLLQERVSVFRLQFDELQRQIEQLE